MDLRSGLSKARGLGAAHEGAHHWWMQRVSAIALIPLVIWFVISVIKATDLHGVDGVIYLLASPLNAIAMILFLGTSIYHGTLGVKVVIEDYVHCPCGSKILDISTKFMAIVSIVAVTFAIFSVHLRSYGNDARFHQGFWQAGGKGHCSKNIHNLSEKTTQPANDEQNNTSPTIEIESPQE